MSKNTGAGLTVAKSLNLSYAWGAVLLKLLSNGATEVSPLMFCITDFDPESGPEEDAEIRAALDRHLISKGRITVDKVAFTIFPEEYWMLADGDVGTFFEDYKQAAPRLRKMHKDNCKGLYFERLIGFGADYKKGLPGINQLEKIALNYASGTHRRSMLQATTYDPTVDLTNRPYQGFPCLQHVTFAPEDGGLTLNAFYTYQYLVTKAYGNLLGLIGLGKFMASIFRTPFTKLILNAGVEHLDAAKRDKTIIAIAELLKSKDLSGTLYEI